MAGIALAADSTTVVLNGTAILDLAEGGLHSPDPGQSGHIAYQQH